MEKVLVGIIAMSELCVVHSHVQRQFHFVYEPKTWTDALSYCREKYTDLATINSEEDMKLLNNRANLSHAVLSQYSSRAWIGLHHGAGSWTWSLSTPNFYSKGKAEFRNWDSGEPSDSGSCGEMYPSGKWNDVGCGGLMWPVCSAVTGLNVSFHLISTAMTWSNAQRHCREHYTDLASFRTMEEVNKVQKMLNGGAVWFGLFMDFWKWLDGSPSSFRFWKIGEPKNNFADKACVAADMSDFGKWENRNCDLKFAFVCYSEPSIQVIKVNLMTQSSLLDLNNPAVMDNILKQLKRRLKDQGVNEDVKLSWRRQADGKVFHKVETKREEKNKEEMDFGPLP